MLDRLDPLVVKPTSESGGKGVYIGPTATDEAVARQRRAAWRPIAGSLRSWCALSTVPDRAPRGELAPRHVDLRPFAVFG